MQTGMDSTIPQPADPGSPHSVSVTPRNPKSRTGIESRTIYAALATGALGAILGLVIGLVFPPLPLFGGWASMGSIVAVAAGVVAAIAAGVGYWQVRDRAGEHLSALTVTMHMIAIILVHAVLAALATLTIFLVLSRGLIGVMVPAFWASAGMAVILGLTVYLVYPSVSRITTQRLSSLLMAFVIMGTLTAMVTATDPAWWKIHFSYLGSFSTISGAVFNGTLIVGGILVSTFGFHLAHDIKLMVDKGLLREPAVRFVRTLFVVMGVMLAGVGLVPIDLNVTIHNICASGLAVVYLTFLIAGHWVLRELPRAYFIATWGFLAALGLTVIFFAVGIFGVTSLEIVVFSLIFGWISVFIRFLGEVGSAQSPRAIARIASGPPLTT